MIIDIIITVRTILYKNSAKITACSYPCSCDCADILGMKIVRNCLFSFTHMLVFLTNILLRRYIVFISYNEW